MSGRRAGAPRIRVGYIAEDDDVIMSELMQSVDIEDIMSDDTIELSIEDIVEQSVEDDIMSDDIIELDDWARLGMAAAAMAPATRRAAAIESSFFISASV